MRDERECPHRKPSSNVCQYCMGVLARSVRGSVPVVAANLLDSDSIGDWKVKSAEHLRDRKMVHVVVTKTQSEIGGFSKQDSRIWFDEDAIVYVVRDPDGDLKRLSGN